MDYSTPNGKGDNTPITLRDHFAAAALTGILANENEIHAPAETASEAFIQADAMLAEQDKGKPPAPVIETAGKGDTGSLVAALRELMAAVSKVGDWSPDTRVGRALDAADGVISEVELPGAASPLRPAQQPAPTIVGGVEVSLLRAILDDLRTLLRATDHYGGQFAEQQEARGKRADWLASILDGRDDSGFRPVPVTGTTGMGNAAELAGALRECRDRIDSLMRAGFVAADGVAKPAVIRADAALAAYDNAAPPPSDGVSLIAAERRRQVEQEGYTPEHDDRHGAGELTDEAIAYATVSSDLVIGERFDDAVRCGEDRVVFHVCTWKPSPDPIRNLVKAGALLAAEIDRLQRAKGKAAPADPAQPET